MRFLLGILKFVVILGVVGFAALWFWSGQAKGEGTNVSSVVIAAPPEKVFPWLSEPEKVTQWIGGLKEVTSLSEGGTRLGAKGREVMVEGGEEYVFEDEVTAYDPPRSMEVTLRSDAFDVVSRYDLATEGDTTRLTSTVTTVYKPFVARLMEPIVTIQAQSKLSTDLKTLKLMVEEKE